MEAKRLRQLPVTDSTRAPCIAVENGKTCGEPSLTDAIGVCYDHAKLCVLCREEPASPTALVCPGCKSQWLLGASARDFADLCARILRWCEATGRGPIDLPGELRDVLRKAGLS